MYLMDVGTDINFAYLFYKELSYSTLNLTEATSVRFPDNDHRGRLKQKSCKGYL